jgi:MOSC domain-containing protein YiiM
MGRVEAVSVGEVGPSPSAKLGTSGIGKRPVAGPVRVGTEGVEGDAVVNRKHHGGPDQAVYAFAREDYAHWEAELGRTLRAGSFGENLTTIGVDVQDARLGERWQVGSCLLEVTHVRIPCIVFAAFVDEPRWVRRFTEHGVPGAYLRVLEPGSIAAGDPIEVVETRPHDLTVGYAFRALTTQPELLPALASEERIGSRLRERLERLGPATPGPTIGA